MGNLLIDLCGDILSAIFNNNMFTILCGLFLAASGFLVIDTIKRALV